MTRVATAMAVPCRPCMAYIIIMHLRLQCTHCREVYMAESAIAYSVMRSAHYSKLDSTQTLDTLKILYAPISVLLMQHVIANLHAHKPFGSQHPLKDVLSSPCMTAWQNSFRFTSL